MISTITNTQIKKILRLAEKAKFRNEQDCYIVEGIKMFTEIPEEELIDTYVSEGFLKDGENRGILKDIRYEIIRDNVFKTFSDTVTPQGILAIVRQKHYVLGDLFDSDKGIGASPKFYLILENIRDPGNLGTMVRTGEAAGISGIILNNGSANIYNPKAVRATMGSIFRVPFLYTDNLPETVGIMKKGGVRIYSAHLHGENMYQTLDYQHDSAFIIGNESTGVSGEMRDSSDKLIKIPMHGQVESLNAAVSAAIIMYSFLQKC